MIRQQVANQDQEDEVFQNLYLSLVCSPPPLPLTNVLGYLNTVIRNDIIDAVRRQKSQQQHISKYALSQPRDDVEDAPDERVTRAEDARRVTGLLTEILPSREAQVVLERYVYGRSTNDIALHLQVKKRTVSHYASVGLRRIR